MSGIESAVFGLIIGLQAFCAIALVVGAVLASGFARGQLRVTVDEAGQRGHGEGSNGR